MMAGWLSLLCLIAALCAGTAAAQTGRVRHPGSIREIAATPNATITRTALTQAELDAPMDIEIALKMRNFSELQDRLARGHLIPKAEMDAMHHPLAADYQAVLAWLKGEGFTITRGDSGRLAIFATGTVANVARSFQTTFARVSLRGREHSSAITAPLLPAEISDAILGVNGLQPHLAPQKHSRKMDAKPFSTTGNGPPFLPSQIMTAYSAAGVTATGAGQTIGIVIDTFPLNSDLTAFWTAAGVPQSLSNISEIQVVSGTLAAPSGEETLDTEWSSGIAPGAKIRIYATYDLSSVHLDAAYSQILSEVSGTSPAQPTLHQFSMSYGAGEYYSTTSQMQTDEQYFSSISATGVTVFASSGDGGSNPNPNNHGWSGGAVTTAENPASSYSVTGVGGTSLTVNSTTGAETSETVWNDTTTATGGGISTVFTRPPWQTGTGVPTGTFRLIPDVAAVADPNTGAFVYLNGANAQYGGTSWSSPTWAGLCAIINQTRAANGLPPLGLLGPKIYPLNGTGAFRDITSGNNGSYSAGVGYDLCTGIGVPNVAALVSVLSGTPLITTQPSSQLPATGQNATFTVVAGGAAPLAFQWQREPNGSSVWSNLTDGTTYTGSATASLTVASVTAAMSGDRFRCVVTNALGNVTSNSATLLVGVAAAPLVVNSFAGVAGTAGSTNGTGSAALFNTPGGIAVDTSGNIYVADTGNQTIRKVTPAGVVSLYAGTVGAAGSSNTGTITFNTPSNVAVDASGNVYVADAGNQLIRKITPAKLVSTLAGRAGRSGSTNSTGTNARFYNPQGVAVDSSGNVYVADSSNNMIRKITSAGVVTTLAGSTTSGSTDGTGTAARFNYPVDVAVDSSGNVYVADTNNNTIRKITPAGVVTTIAGTAGVAGSSDGLAASATFKSPSGIRVDSAGNLYIADSGNQTIRLLTPAGIVTTIAGTAGTIGSTNGVGSAALFNYPSNAAPDANGNVYIIDTSNDTLRIGTFAAAPAFQVQPVSLSILSGLNATFTASAGGNPAPAYQWQRLPAGGAAWANLTDGGAYSGSATGTLSVAGATAAMNGDQFQCVASNAVGSATSVPQTLTVGVAPLLTSQSAATFLLGTPGTFTITASGTPAPTFAITGLPSWASFNTATGTLTGTPPNGTGSPFTLTVTAANGFGSVASQQFTLTVQGTFSLWQSLYFANGGTSPNAGALATPAGDGIPNLIKYALGANPLVPSASALPAGALAIDPNDGQPHLTLTVSLDATATGITVTPQVSSDVVTWQSGAGYTEIASDSTVNGIRTVTFRDLTPAGTPGVNRYIRLSVSMP
jgi:kumamolisin